MSFRACVVIPCYNHHRVIADTTAALLQQGFTVIIVDDASDDETAQVLSQLADVDNQLIVETLAVNLGKGGAVIHGLRKAAELGFSHAVQLDADGQHDLADMAGLLDLAKANPDALNIVKLGVGPAKACFAVGVLCHLPARALDMGMSVAHPRCSFYIIKFCVRSGIDQ